MKRARLLLADDHPVILEGLRAVLQPHHDIVGVVTDGKSALEAASRLNPDVIILDIGIPLLNGIEVARQVKVNLPEITVLFVTMHASPLYLREALNAGATGYVLKASAREEIVKAVCQVLNGQTYITPGIGGEDFNPYGHRPVGDHVSPQSLLSARERDILELVAHGHTAKEIASILHISVKTIAFHREKMKKKLGLRNIAELTRYAMQESLL